VTGNNLVADPPAKITAFITTSNQGSYFLPIMAKTSQTYFIYLDSPSNLKAWGKVRRNVEHIYG